jgi:hypothetical protein
VKRTLRHSVLRAAVCWTLPLLGAALPQIATSLPPLAHLETSSADALVGPPLTVIPEGQFSIQAPTNEAWSVIGNEPTLVVSACDPAPALSNCTPATHSVVYDEGWILRPFDASRMPFELKFSFHNQFRYTGFANEAAAVVNSAGNIVPTPPRNDFHINRGRIVLAGYAIDPLLEFYANIDYNTVAEQQIQMLMAWVRHPFDPAFNVAYGLGKVPGTWEWLESARFTLGAERSLATTFFRPSMTAGVWVDGEMYGGWNYHLLVGNGFNTVGLNTTQLDTNLVYSGMAWWEPLGPFGNGFSDFDDHASPVLRFGHALTYDRHGADPTGEPGPEQTVVRLSDGTRLVEAAALAPGVTVNQFDLTLYSVHSGVKYRGWSVSAEYFFRWLTRIQADGPIGNHAYFDHGFFAQVGVFAAPQSVELFGRGSAVYGPFGNGSEVGGGLNWYVVRTPNWRFTADVAYVSDSSAQQDRTGFSAGASGTLVRMQMWTYF